MTLLRPSRRGFLIAAASLLAAPAIVRVASIMPVKAIEPLRWQDQIAAHVLNAPFEGDFSADNLVYMSTERYTYGYVSMDGVIYIPSRTHDADVPGHVLSADAFKHINLPSTYQPL